MTSDHPFLDVHTPISSFAIAYSNTDDTLDTLFDKLSKKVYAQFNGRRVRTGWVKYDFNGTVWNLEDDADYAIFVWRQRSITPESDIWPALHLYDPEEPLPSPTDYRNPAFYAFRPRPPPSPQPSLKGDKQSTRSGKSRRSTKPARVEEPIPQHKKAFTKFHSENGVRTVLGSIGPVKNVRMLLKSGYRHVYISRKFAIRHGFIPADAAPGHYGYGGLVNIGNWPITVGRTKTSHAVYLSEESHFDVVLGRSFMEHRQIRTDPVDPTDVVCMDTGEKIDCELVILKDGKGQIVTVT